MAIPDGDFLSELRPWLDGIRGLDPAFAISLFLHCYCLSTFRIAILYLHRFCIPRLVAE